VLAGAAVLVISPDALIVRAVGTDAWTTVAWRGILTAAGTLAILGARGLTAPSAPRGTVRTTAAAAALFAIASVAFVTALYRTDAASVLAIVAAGPTIGALLAWVGLGERPAPRTWVAAGAVAGGLALIVTTDGARGQLDGSLLALLASSCFAGFLTLARGARPADMTPALALGAAAAGLAGVLAGAELTLRAGDLLLLAVLGLAILPVSLTLLARATHHLPAPEVGLIALLETLLGPLWVWLGVGERPDPRVVAGGVLVVVAVGLHAAAALRAARAQPAGP
jgi:drug/metabolite transporter (DMT)-like permease